MVKKREIKKEDIEKFAAGADSYDNEQSQTLDPNAKRDFKKIQVPFNEWEYNNLVELTTLTSRSKLGAMRWAINMALEIERKKHE